jgi:sugar lactone lactonase YvrE
VVTTFAGGNAQGATDATDGTAQFNAPGAVSVDAAGNVYVADTSNHRIRKITPAAVVTTLAGSTQGFVDATDGSAKFDTPRGVAADASGNLYVADTNNHRIRKVTPAGVVTTLAGGTQGFADGTGAAAQFNAPQGVAVDAAGNVFVADTGNNRIRKITSAGVVTSVDGTAYASPKGLAVDALGNLYVADTGNHRIQKIAPDNTVSTVAGGTQGFSDGTGAGALFNSPTGISVDAVGDLFVADAGNNRIRLITPDGVVTTLAGTGTAGFLDDLVGTSATTQARFNGPLGVAVDASGNVYVADTANHRIRKVL